MSNEDHVDIYQDKADEWRWKRVAPNGEIVATSGEGYLNYQDCFDEAQIVNKGVEIRG